MYFLADLLKNEPSTGNDKLVWLLVVLNLRAIAQALRTPHAALVADEKLA